MKDRMQAGGLYIAADAELRRDFGRAQELLEAYNTTREAESDERNRLLDGLLGDVGTNVLIKPPFRCDYGWPISIGDGTFINSQCTMIDVGFIRIGRDCQLGTRVQLLAATHPIDPEPRRLGWLSGAPVTIRDNVWLGSGVIVCPGVTIGENTVVGSGAVVTRDLPPMVVADGVPAKVIRRIDGERDHVVTGAG